MSVITNYHGTLEYLAAEGISVPHCFTTRRGGVSIGVLSSLNISAHRGDSVENVKENFRILSDALGFEMNGLVLSRQTHSDIVRVVTRADHAGLDHSGYPECDVVFWDKPTGDICPDCGSMLVQTKGKSSTVKCSNPECKYKEKKK